MDVQYRHEFCFGEEITSLRDMVQRWAAENLAPRAAEIDATNSFAADLWPALGGLAFWELPLTQITAALV